MDRRSSPRGGTSFAAFDAAAELSTRETGLDTYSLLAGGIPRLLIVSVPDRSASAGKEVGIKCPGITLLAERVRRVCDVRKVRYYAVIIRCIVGTVRHDKIVIGVFLIQSGGIDLALIGYWRP
jgi:hypothetical protein